MGGMLYFHYSDVVFVSTRRLSRFTGPRRRQKQAREQALQARSKAQGEKLRKVIEEVREERANAPKK